MQTTKRIDLFQLLTAITYEAMWSKLNYKPSSRRSYASAIGLPAACGDLSKKRK